MPVQFACKSCQRLLSVSRKRIGTAVRCPACQTELIVPGSGPPGQATTSARPAPPRESASSTAAGDPWAKVYEDAEEDAFATAELTPGDVLPALRQPLEPQSRGVDAARPPAVQSGLRGRSPARSVPPSPAVDELPLGIRRPKTEFEDMDLTPMVDVTFLLLIFFMITASFSMQKTIQIPKPDPDQQSAAQSIVDPSELEKNSIIVQIDRNNRIFIEYEPAPDASDLSEQFRNKIRTSQKRELVVEADPRAFHETVVKVVDAANAAEFQRIRLATVSVD